MTELVQAAKPPVEVPAALQREETVVQRAYRFIGHAQRAYCDSDSTMKSCVDVDAALQQTIKDVEDLRKSIVDGALAAQRNANGVFNPLKDFLEAARKHVQGLIIAYRKRKDDEARAAAETERKRLEEEALKQAQALAESGQAEQAEAVLAEGADLAQAVGAPVQTGPVRGAMAGTASIGKKWGFRVIDEAAVPRAYCVVSEPLIRKAAPKHPAPPPGIPGVEWIEEDTFTNR